ncbi:iron-sulfur cluster biosynthesis family protein [Paenibacillaceae bacterium]|nr:iron-sulfur cluster biosynthesis family protein [Paenibacillaceae bacterium]
MKILFTNAAVAQLTPRFEQTGAVLKLLYDTEGCGCVVSGVPALQLLDEPGPDDQQGEGVPLAFWHEPRFEIFFEPELVVDYNEERRNFILKSDSQIYTNRLRLLTDTKS